MKYKPIHFKEDMIMDKLKALARMNKHHKKAIFWLKVEGYAKKRVFKHMFKASVMFDKFNESNKLEKEEEKTETEGA